MVRRFVLFLIVLYQRYLSPKKGFVCAHHQLYGQQTCSQAVAALIKQHGVWLALPKVQERFRDCRAAYDQLLSSSDHLACDVDCGIGAVDCAACDLGGGGSAKRSGSCAWPCDILDLVPDRKHRKQTFIIAVAALLIFSYWFYGRGVIEIEIAKNETNSGWLQNLGQRQEPDLRAVLIVGNKKFYTEVKTLKNDQQSIVLRFEDVPLSYRFDSLKLLDARLNLGADLLVIGQTVEEFNDPGRIGNGSRFNYRLLRRWHFF